MKITGTDQFLAQIARRMPRSLQWLGDIETWFLREQLESLPIERPVFICGLARSGSTLLLRLLAEVEGVATHRYRDFPFLAAPWLWSLFVDRFTLANAPLERPHRDRIMITSESPESMEEPFWIAWFPSSHSATQTHRVPGTTLQPQFEKALQEHIRKILHLRQGTRYVSKNNYHIARIAYLARIFPDAHFVVPIRHPLTHVDSLVRQHGLFCRYALEEPRVPSYLRAAGHFEFGPQRVPLRLNHSEADRTCEAWLRGEEYVGYATQWRSVYGAVREFQRDAALSKRIRVFPYEEFCQAPQSSLEDLLGWLGLSEAACIRKPELGHVAQSTSGTLLKPEQRGEVWQQVSEVALSFGYHESAG